ncbi:MAG: GtrA family protein [Oscillospiraceae bacterium]|nr:GtrA family protein [Oscillospiraceae bacterium]
MIEKIKNLFDAKMKKFLLVGILNTLVGNGLSFLLLNLVPWERFSVGSAGAVNLSSGISTALASIMSYYLNKYYTFQYKGKDRAVFFRFAINIAVCYFIAYTLVSNLTIALLSGQADWIRENVSMVVGMCTFVGCNYIGQRYFAFREKEDPKT